MDTEATLLRASQDDPADDTVRLALADWLEEQDRLPESELLRLHVHLRQGLVGEEMWQAEARLRELIIRGVRPRTPIIHNHLSMSFVLIPPGKFWMGSPPEEPDRFIDEGPEREVSLTRPFYLGVFPVTQAEFTAVMGANPSHFSASGNGREQVVGADTGRHPVENISWEDAVAFCAVLSGSAAERDLGRVYRLPTEAEWEYACRAGISRIGPFHFGRALSSTQANFDGRFPYGDAETGPALRTTTPVDAYPPNAMGVYDLHGNVSEWCSDQFDENYYLTGSAVDPQGADEGAYRVLRGGSWGDAAKYCRAAFRYDRPPDEGRHDFGIRLVLEYRKP